MEEKELTNESILPEEGAAPAQENEQIETNVTAEENVESIEETQLETEEKVPEKEEAVKEEPKKEGGFTKEDYSLLPRVDMLAKLNQLINQFHVNVVRDAVEDIKLNFYKSYKAEKAGALAKFIEDGSKEEDFKFTDDSTEETFKELYNVYKRKKSAYLSELEGNKKQNLAQKIQIVEEIKVLINKEESINKTFQEFRELQQKWHNIGLVPQNDVKALWENYHHVVEQFYDYININKELRDLDLKKNLELKITLCEKAEALLLEESITKAFKSLQDYHNTWREVGPVPREQKDDIWDRFKAVTTQINKKHQEYFEGLKEQQVDNLAQKVVLCEKVEEINQAEYLKPKDWEEKANELIEIQKLWRTVGFAPKKDNNKIYQRFKAACDEFFSKKREYYKAAKDVQKNNLQLKLDLCIQAEALKESEEWKKTTEDFIKLQKRWKEIGPVPKKQSETLWKRFRGACDSFFNDKDEFFNTVDSRQEDNLQLKLDLIEKVKGYQKAEDDKENLKQLMAMQKEWSDIGFVPINKKEEIQKAFRDALNDQFDQLKIDDEERSKLNFKTKVDSWVSTKSTGKIYSERNKIVNRIKELENEVLLYENNIGFFSSSKNAGKMIEDINHKIEQARERMKSYKSKLRMLDNAEDAAE